MGHLQGTIDDKLSSDTDTDDSKSLYSCGSSSQRIVVEKPLIISTLPKKLIFCMYFVMLFAIMLLAIALSFHSIGQSSREQEEDLNSRSLKLIIANLNSTELLPEDQESGNLTLNSILRAKLWSFKVTVQDDEPSNAMMKFLCVVVVILALVFVAFMPFFVYLYMSSEVVGRDKVWSLMELTVEKFYETEASEVAPLRDLRSTVCQSA